MKTNLWKGDRVRLSEAYLASQNKLARKSKDRTGTIVSNTSLAIAKWITVRWDGNEKANRCDQYTPEELTLYEEEYEVA